jgi:hypothetical protein
MPTYCYRKEATGELIDLTISIMEKEEREVKFNDGTQGIYLDDGTRAYRDIVSEQRCGKSFPGNWPMYSDALGVNPTQIKDAIEQASRAGVPTEFDKKTGCAILRSPGHRKALCEALGYYDRNAGYSDPKPKNRSR